MKREDQYALQGPFLANFYSGLREHVKTALASPDPFDLQRKQLAQDDQEIKVVDFGAGSKKLKSNIRSTSQIYKFSTSGRKFSTIYSYLCSQTPALHVLELGTCLGINCLYLAKSTRGNLFSFEGSPSLLEKANGIKIFSHINFIAGNITQTLPEHLKNNEKVDFALIDATHTYEATLSYFKILLPYLKEESIIVIADIHWSKGMEKAWNEIREDLSVSLSLDFYECGVLFFKKGLSKSHYILSI